MVRGQDSADVDSAGVIVRLPCCWRPDAPGIAPLELGTAYDSGMRRVTVIAPTCNSLVWSWIAIPPIEPDFASEARNQGGGYFKIINQSLPSALQASAYREAQIRGHRGLLRGAIKP